MQIKGGNENTVDVTFFAINEMQLTTDEGNLFSNSEQAKALLHDKCDENYEDDENMRWKDVIVVK